MNKAQSRMFRQYSATLRRYLNRQHEGLLQQAYETGRNAIVQGLGVLDVARIHQQALATCFTYPLSAATHAHAIKAVETFFMEALSPFEAAHRGFRQANLQLQHLNRDLERRGARLAAANLALEREVAERKRTEAELRESKDHYRKLFEQAQIMQENLRDLSNQVLHVQEEERKRISRELHDEIGQALTAINVNLAMARNSGPRQRPKSKRHLAEAQRLLQMTMETTHRFALELRPAMLDDLGLLPALRSYVNGFAERTGVRVQFEASPAAEMLNDDQKTTVYRVAQESLTNVAKHAHASQVMLSLRKLKHGICMEIRDNGHAFEAEKQLNGNGKKRLGLLGMQERVRLVNGEFEIASAIGRGTTVRVQIPYKMP